MEGLLAEFAEVSISNEQLADLLLETADLLEIQRANKHRANAWRKASAVVRKLEQPIAELYRSEGFDALDRLPNIGETIGRAIECYVKTGVVPLRNRLKGQLRPAILFTTVSSIGIELAQRIHDHLHIESLHELYRAARDGRLAKVPGMGEKRIRAVRESLAGRFSLTKPNTSPSISDLLALDAEYRRLAESDGLPTIAPYRFNPDRIAWLPIWHTRKGDRNYTVMYSNTARANALGKTRDWVVILLDEPSEQGQWTVITAEYGLAAGKRIVRGVDR